MSKYCAILYITSVSKLTQGWTYIYRYMFRLFCPMMNMSTTLQSIMGVWMGGGGGPEFDIQ